MDQKNKAKELPKIRPKIHRVRFEIPSSSSIRDNLTNCKWKRRSIPNGNSGVGVKSTVGGGFRAAGASFSQEPRPPRPVRVYPTSSYKRHTRATLSPQEQDRSSSAAVSPRGLELLKAARDGDENLLRRLIRQALATGADEHDLNAVDSSGRTILSYIVSDGLIELVEIIVQLPKVDPNLADNEGNTPLHFAAQAGHLECLNCLLSRCSGIDIDTKNHFGFTPLMKAALQGRNKCAKLLLFAGANPTLRDGGRGLRADEWARYCGQYVCADIIERHARRRLLERSTSYGHWGGERAAAQVLMGRVVPLPPHLAGQLVHDDKNLKSKLKRVFAKPSSMCTGVCTSTTTATTTTTTTGAAVSENAYSSLQLVTHLTSAALCASSPILPSVPTAVPPMVKSLIRPLVIPRLYITLVQACADAPASTAESAPSETKDGATGEKAK